MSLYKIKLDECWWGNSGWWQHGTDHFVKSVRVRVERGILFRWPWMRTVVWVLVGWTMLQRFFIIYITGFWGEMIWCWKRALECGRRCCCPCLHGQIEMMVWLWRNWHRWGVPIQTVKASSLWRCLKEQHVSVIQKQRCPSDHLNRQNYLYFVGVQRTAVHEGHLAYWEDERPMLILSSFVCQADGWNIGPITGGKSFPVVHWYSRQGDTATGWEKTKVIGCQLGWVGDGLDRIAGGPPRTPVHVYIQEPSWIWGGWWARW